MRMQVKIPPGFSEKTLEECVSMSTRDIQKTIILFSTCLAVLVLLVAFLFAMFSNWGASRLSTNTEPCHELSARAPALTEEELQPLAQEEEEHLNSVATPLTEKQPIATKEEPAPAATTLVAPQQLSPKKVADLRHHRSIRFHWESVIGAKTYHVQAWQVLGDKKIFLIDTQTPETEVRVVPQNEAVVYWQVAAIDEQGNAGEVAGPITIDLLKKTPYKRNPAHQRW